MKAVNKNRTTKLRLAPIPADLARPTLKLTSSRQLPLLFASFTGALGLMAGICGCLATILITSQFIQPELEHSKLIIISNTESESSSQTETEENPPPQAPTRITTLPTPPSSKIKSFTPPQTAPPTDVEIPNIEVEPINLEDFEEPIWDDSFASESQTNETKKEVPKTSPTPESVQKAHQENLQRLAAQKKREAAQKLAAQKLAAQKKREAAQKAALAKKMAKSATVISQAAPDYPRSARRKKIQGRVIIVVSIGTQGQITACSVSQSSGDSSLDQSALIAARKFRFTAAINGLGQAMPSSKKIPFDFRLQ